MNVQFALPTPLYMALMGVCGGDSRASANVDFEAFVQGLQAIGFRSTNGTNGTRVVLRAPASFKTGANRILEIKRPVPGQGWWPYEYTDVALSLEEKFDITGATFMEVDADVTGGNQVIVIPARA
ncbi:hypothetical protein FKP32DRAFT_1672420 [Trametes sanguinea]|nr:hypothetical protein FKP32DRAFT_1672420 [Trametes sanguinea]